MIAPALPMPIALSPMLVLSLVFAALSAVPVL
jgi:hypothetical protein